MQAMLHLGAQELIFILVLALLIFGPKRLPEIGRVLGKGLGEFRKASNDLQRTFNAEIAEQEELRREIETDLKGEPEPDPDPELHPDKAPAATQARTPVGRESTPDADAEASGDSEPVP